MGYMRHHAIVVTSCDEKLLEKAHEKAKGLFNNIAGITPDFMNGYRSFLVAPDGSKEGWEHSDQGDEARDIFIDWMNEQCYEDGSSSLEYVEIQFGGDDNETVLLRSR